MTNAVLFDLDGTVADSIELILNSARHAFVGFDGTAPTDEQWRAGIGRPLITVLREWANGDEDEAQRLLARYREFQMEHHDRLLRPYPGMLEALHDLKASGFSLGIVTSKSDWLAQRAVDYLGMTSLFDVLIGCDSCVNHKPHPEPVERALALLNAAAESSIYVGDSPHDIESGNAAGTATIGVTWGAFSRSELEQANVVIDEVAELATAVQAVMASRV